LLAWKSAIVEHVYLPVQEIALTIRAVTTPACSLFSEKPLRASKWIRYDSGLFGRDDKR
jgi:hypothetical protein